MSTKRFGPTFVARIPSCAGVHGGGPARPIGTLGSNSEARDRGSDRDVVAALLGREPRGFEVVVRDRAGVPVVISNPPILDDSTPMPTRFWLVARDVRAAVSRLESAGGVREAEAAVDPAELEAAHALYAAERRRDIPEGYRGAVPSGGVGGTRKGVKCLHAHLAWYLAGGNDPVGVFVAERLGIDRSWYVMEDG